jgi:hypothetical protein
MADKMKPGPKTPVRQHRFDGDERPNIPTARFVEEVQRRVVDRT